MKKLWSLIAIAMLFVGCEEKNPTLPNEGHHIPHGNPWVEPQSGVGFEVDKMNVLPFPFELSSEAVNAKGENVWYYYYEDDSTNKEDFWCRVDFVMHCNHTVDFDFINYPMIYQVISNYYTSSGVDSNMFCSVSSCNKRFPELSDFYYCTYRDCTQSGEGEVNYDHEMVFSLLFPKVGQYRVCLQLMSFDDTQSVYETLYGYETHRYEVDIQVDLDNKTNEGGVVTLRLNK